LSRNDIPQHKHERKWGQNFLRNQGAVRRIAEAVQPLPGETILEIGPGEGILTVELLKLGAPLTVIEIDPRLAESLQTRFAGQRVEIISQDALIAPLPRETFCAVGNLPYNVGTPILKRILTSASWRRAVFMLQREVANRVVATPGEEDYGYLSLHVAAFAEARILMRLEAGSFHPRPRVQSAVVVLEKIDRGLITPPDELLALISAAFRMRRKKLVNNITGFKGHDRSSISTALKAADIPADIRAEMVSLHEFDRLGGMLERY